MNSKILFLLVGAILYAQTSVTGPQGGSGGGSSLPISTFTPLGITSSIVQPTDGTTDTLATLTIPANSTTTGSRFSIRIEATVANNAINWTPTVNVAGTSVGTLSSTTNTGYLIDVECTLNSTTSLACSAARTLSGSGASLPTVVISITAGQSIAVQLQGRNGSSQASNATVYGFAVLPQV